MDKQLQHQDDIFEVDDCLVIGKIGQHFVHLIPSGESQTLKPDGFGYKLINSAQIG